MKSLGGAAVLATVMIMATGCSSSEASADHQTRLQKAYSACKKSQIRAAFDGIDIDSDGKGMSLATGKHNSPNEQAQVDGMVCILQEVGTPKSLITRMDTTALMGDESASRDGLDYDWTYHPDQGMNMTIEESGS